ncbi:uncharacterized, partial [Tachysurus ichikawai]
MPQVHKPELRPRQEARLEAQQEKSCEDERNGDKEKSGTCLWLLTELQLILILPWCVCSVPGTRGSLWALVGRHVLRVSPTSPLLSFLHSANPLT